MKSIVILLSVFAVGFCHEFFYANMLVDSQLAYMRHSLNKSNYKFIKIGDITVNNKIKVSGLRLGDITNVVRKGDSILTVNNGKVTLGAAVGVDRLTLAMESLKLNGIPYHKVIVVVRTNKLSSSGFLTTSRTNCNFTLSNIFLSNITDVILHERIRFTKNITSQFIQDVVPYVNGKLNSPAVKKTLEQWMDPCKQEFNGLSDFFKNKLETDKFLKFMYPSIKDNSEGKPKKSFFDTFKNHYGFSDEDFNHMPSIKLNFADVSF